MNIKAIAEQWAKEHPDFSGILGVRTMTARGRGGRFGSKLTIYRYVCTAGRAAKERSYGMFNGICDVTRRVYLEPVLAWYRTESGVFVTTASTAQELGAEWVDAFSEHQHPQYPRQWQCGAEIEPTS